MVGDGSCPLHADRLEVLGSHDGSCSPPPCLAAPFLLFMAVHCDHGELHQILPCRANGCDPQPLIIMPFPEDPNGIHGSLSPEVQRIPDLDDIVRNGHVHWSRCFSRENDHVIPGLLELAPEISPNVGIQIKPCEWGFGHDAPTAGGGGGGPGEGAGDKKERIVRTERVGSFFRHAVQECCAQPLSSDILPGQLPVQVGHSGAFIGEVDLQYLSCESHAIIPKFAGE